MSDLAQVSPEIRDFLQRHYPELFGYGLSNAWITGRGLVAVSELSREPKYTYIPLYAVERGSDPVLAKLLRDYDHFTQVVFGCPHPRTSKPHYTVLELMWRVK